MKTEHRFRKEKPRSVPSIHQNCAYLKAIKLENDVNFSQYTELDPNQHGFDGRTANDSCSYNHTGLGSHSHPFSQHQHFQRKAIHSFLPGSHQEPKAYICIYVFALKNEKKNQPQNPNEKPK